MVSSFALSHSNENVISATMEESRRICIVGSLGRDGTVVEAAKSFQIPVIITDSGHEYIDYDTYITYFILNEFEGDMFELLVQKKCR